MLHDFKDTSAFELNLHTSDIEYHLQSDAGRKVIAEQYVGLPFEKIE